MDGKKRKSKTKSSVQSKEIHTQFDVEDYFSHTLTDAEKQPRSFTRVSRDDGYAMVDGVDGSGNLRQLLDKHCDILCATRKPSQSEAYRETFAQYALNYALTRRTAIKKNSDALKTEEKECRDQGFTRPTVLIITPFRNGAKDIVDLLIKHAPEPITSEISNKDRFEEEFGGDKEFAVDRPADFLDAFSGNTDDSYKIGVSFLRKTLKLYAPFYKADMIIASPLGLKLIVGASGDKERDYDFLSSIELVIVDQVDVILTQNWDHLVEVFAAINQKPKKNNETDFSRVRQCYLDNEGKFFRQSVFLSAFPFAELNGLFNLM